MKRCCLFLILAAITLLYTSSAQATCDIEEWCGVSAEEITAYPQPNVTQLAADEALITDRVYRRMVGVVDVYDAPNGGIVNTFGVGFNFVTVLSTEGEWSQISEGRWVRSTQLSEDVALSRYAGVLLPAEPLPYQMGWILVNLYSSPVPGGTPIEDMEHFLVRYTKVNLYAAVEIGGWLWYQVGVDQWVHQTQIAKIIPIERPEGVDTERWVSVDLYEQVAIAYEGDTPVFATLVASGLPEWSTNEGLFHVYVRYERTLMSGAEGQSDFYYLEEVPWTMYFDDDIALHGTYWHDGFGYRHSHGCVNLSITDAHWLYAWAAIEFDFTIENDLGPAVYVYSSGIYV